jgi:hypothetical protein
MMLTRAHPSVRALALFVFVAAAFRLLAADGFAATTKGIPCGAYTGAVGSYPIVAEFCVDIVGSGETARPRNTSGRYYYRNHGVSIKMEETPEADGTIRLQELVYSETALRLVPSGDVWRVRVTGDRVAGTWCRRCDAGRTTKPLAARLDRIGNIRTASLYDDGDGYHMEMLAYPLSRSAERSGGPAIAYATVSDDRFGAAMIELTRFPNERARRTANENLAADLRQSRIDAFDCLGAANMLDGSGIWDEHLEVSRLTANVLSVDRRISYSGCAAYPTADASAPITLDMRSGTAVDWSKAMVPGAEATLVRRYPRYVPDSGCPFSELFPGSGFSYWLTAAGLAIRPRFPHVAASCNIVVIIPNSQARRLFREPYRTRWFTRSRSSG